MSLIFIQGRVDVSTFKKVCTDNKLVPKGCIFIFPGNSSHHDSRATLFSIKGGAGLASASEAIGEAGYPTLSLPTTTMESWASNKSQQETVQGALEDLYFAIGMGYHLVLPVRPHSNTTYFDQPLSSGKNVELNFWGGVQKAANKALANHYIKQLNNLSEFLKLSPEERLAVIQEDSTNPFYQVYLDGTKSSVRDFKLAKSREKIGHGVSSIDEHTTEAEQKTEPKTTQSTEKEEATQTTFSIPSKPTFKTQTILTKNDYTFFGRLSRVDAKEKPKTDLEKARDILNDYTQNNSWLKRVFAGYWNRHHVKEVHQLVQQINTGSIKTIPDLLAKLEQIKLVNVKGSLAKSIEYIKEQDAAQRVEETKLTY